MRMLMSFSDYKCIICILLSMVGIGACKKADHGGNSILSFAIQKDGNPALRDDVSGVITGDSIVFTIPADSISEIFVPTIRVSGGASVSPKSGAAQNFVQPVAYTVTSNEGVARKYTVSCKATYSYSLLPGKLRIQGALCAYDAFTETYYFPVAMGSMLTTFTVGFDSGNVKTLSFDDLAATNQSTLHKSLTTNQTVKLTAADKNGKSKIFSLVITGLPLINIYSNPLLVVGSYAQSSYSLIDPDYSSKGDPFSTEGKMRFKIRGHTAANYPKKAYALKTEDEHEADLDLPLLGLRDDNSWILDAMYVDQARMRNRVATDIWNSMNNVPYAAKEPEAFNGTRGYMVEMILNQRYNGVYCMTEDMDRKQLKLKKDYGNMYKSDSAGATTEFTGTVPFDNSSAGWGQWELTYPDLDDDRAPDWSYLYQLVDFVANSSDAAFTDSIGLKMDLDNLEDYLLFVNTIGATDNIGKNLYCSFYDYRKAPAFFFTVWDLDASFGRDWKGRPAAAGFGFIGTESRLFQRLLKLNPGNFTSNVKSKWNRLKSAQLSPGTIQSRIDAYGQLLLNSGAWDREKTRWPVFSQELPKEMTYMQDWYTKNYNALDEYLSGN